MDMPPLSTLMPPNQMTATEARFIMSWTTGNISAMSLPMLQEVAVSRLFASSKTSRRWALRTKARMTRMPWICSRITRLTRSMRDCWMRK